MGTLLAALQAIPALLKLVNELITWIKQMQVDQKEKSIKEYLDDMATIIREVKLAKTAEEKRTAASKLRDILGGM